MTIKLIKGQKIDGIDYQAGSIVVGLASITENNLAQAGDAQLLAPAASQPTAVAAAINAIANAGIRRGSFFADGVTPVLLGSVLALAGSPLTTATVGVPYSATFFVSGGVGPYAFDLAGGSLTGTGLAQTSTSNSTTISGTPTSATTIAGLVPRVTDSLLAVGLATAFSIVVTTAPVAPSITTQPTAQTVTVGNTATFSVVAAGTAPLTYQWRKNGVPIGGATGSSYTTPATVLGDSGATFDVQVTNVVNTVTSAAVALTVNAAASTAPRQVVGAGTASTATLFAASTAIAGGTSGSRAIASFTSADGGSGQFGNVFLLASACLNLGGGIYGATFTDPGGTGGWSGTTPANTTPTTTYTGVTENPSRSNDTVTDGSSNLWVRFRMDYHATFTGSIS